VGLVGEQLAVGAGKYDSVAVEIAQPDLAVSRPAWTLRRVSVRRQNDLCIQLLRPGDGRVEVLYFEPQEHAVSVRPGGRVADAPMVVLNRPVMELKDQGSVSVDEALIVAAAVVAASAKESLVPAAGRFDVGSCDQGLRAHGAMLELGGRGACRTRAAISVTAGARECAREAIDEREHLLLLHGRGHARARRTNVGHPIEEIAAHEERVLLGVPLWVSPNEVPSTGWRVGGRHAPIETAADTCHLSEEPCRASGGRELEDVCDDIIAVSGKPADLIARRPDCVRKTRIAHAHGRIV
jgi:hypothetical protein